MSSHSPNTLFKEVSDPDRDSTAAPQTALVSGAQIPQAGATQALEALTNPPI